MVIKLSPDLQTEKIFTFFLSVEKILGNKKTEHFEQND